ncbi:MAG: hypothetical protein MUC88_11230 [Planctomycetes bacterium]|nr:hypothetical protein [Planctomycetota bacterium]
MATQYAQTGVQFLRVISGDHERTALDFQKHYRHHAVYLMDTDLAFQAPHSRDGWPFLMLVDPNGTIVRKVNNLVDGDPALLKALAAMKPAADAPAIRTIDGVSYSSETLRRSGELEESRVGEHSSHLAATPDGRLLLVFTSQRDGDSNVWLRVWEGKTWSEDRPVAASKADEYDGTVVTTRDNQVWFCWTSNASGDKYNIFATSLERLTAGRPPLQITESNDDAMAGRMAIDATGAVWITYYKWQKNSQGFSRDKEVYVRRLQGDTLSREIWISPANVPSYEDHTDPTIACLGDQVLVAWSWDYHRPQGYPQEPESPTIFLRALAADFTSLRLFPASRASVDMVPVLAAQGESAWCAWDSLAARGDTASKSLQLRRVSAAGCAAEPVSLATGLAHLCSPSFATSPQGRLTLVWCQKEPRGNWELWRSDCDPQGPWSKPQALVTAGAPRYGSAAFDAQGRLWVSYAADADRDRRVNVQRF